MGPLHGEAEDAEEEAIMRRIPDVGAATPSSRTLPRLPRKKHGARALFRSAALVVLVASYAVFNAATAGGRNSSSSRPNHGGDLRGSIARKWTVAPIQSTQRMDRVRARMSSAARWLQGGRPPHDAQDVVATHSSSSARRRRLEEDKYEQGQGDKLALLSSSTVEDASESTNKDFTEGLPSTSPFVSSSENNNNEGSTAFASTIRRPPSGSTDGDPSQQRKLLQDCDSIKKANPTWWLLWYIIGVIYMFLAIAIVCDEFFVPALEEMSSERRLNLSMDVAGATLMAAGGSAPELFTSLIGTFRESEVGIGTIVGSATFNVLFVIACCSLFSKEVLKLTWWPLFRDSTYYAIGLVVLAIFVGVVSVGEIELWEAIVLFVMYLGYVLVMAYNKKIYKRITGKDLYPEALTDGAEEVGAGGAAAAATAAAAQ